MAKKKTTGKQRKFDGDGFPEDPPQEVCDARDEYMQAKRAAARASEKKGAKEQTLIDSMREHGIERVRLDGENKFIEIDSPEKVKVKTIPKEQRDARESAA